jgi:hypothetical protein
MKGLPFKANVDDVLKFYQGFSLASSAVYLKRHADGRLNGEVSVRAWRLCDLARRLPTPLGATIRPRPAGPAEGSV